MRLSNRLATALFLTLSPLSWGFAKGSVLNVYIAQRSAGSASGQDCANAVPYTFFDTTANWGSGAAQIGPGTTVHICGTLTFTGGTAGLVAHASGTSANPIVIKFESGALLQSPYFLNGGSSAGGAINVANLSYIVIDGGGTGIIQNTANGTSPNYPNQSPSIGICADGTSNITIQNLTIQDIYVRTSTLDSSIDQTQLNSIHAYPATNLTINHVTMHDAGWHLAVYGNNVVISNCDIYNMDHGIASGLGASGYTGLRVYGNHFHDMASWDDTTGSNAFHHDGVHLWGTSGMGGWSNVYIYNNRFDGDAGAPNGWIYFEYVIGPSYIFNNVFTSAPGSSFPSEIGVFGGSTTQLIANNTMFGYGTKGCSNPGATGFATQSPGVTMKNNLFADQYVTVYFKSPAALAVGGLDNNVYGNTSVACGSTAHTWAYLGSDTQNLSAWQAATGQDAHAKIGTAAQLNLTSTGAPGDGSIAIGAGANLSSLCAGDLLSLCSDINGRARPSLGAWDAGAYQYSAAPAPPILKTPPIVR